MRVFISERLDLTGDSHRYLEQNGVEVVVGRDAWHRPHESFTEDELIEACADVDFVMGASRERFSRRFMEECPNLLLISKYGIGTERIDLEAATELGIVVSNTPVPENYNSVAEHTVTLILSLLRSVQPQRDHVRSGGWRGPDTIVDSLEGLTVGLLGVGRIGGAVARRLQGWNCRLIASDPYVSRNDLGDFDIELVEHAQLLEQSDVLSLHTVVTAETRNIINADSLTKMKSTALLVNTSRGELIDEVALVQALQERRLGGAGLDVTNPEPPSTESQLLRMDNVIVTPHTAAWSKRTIAAIAQAGAENVFAMSRGNRPPFVKNVAVFEHMLRTPLTAP